MLYAAAILIFLSIFSLLYSILAILNRDKIITKERIRKLNESSLLDTEENENKSFSERMLKPFYQSFTNTLLKITPKHKLEMLNKKLDKAGLLKNSNAGRWLFTKLITMILSALLTGLLSFLLSQDITKAAFLALIVMLGVNIFFNFSISRKIDQRKRKILKDLPYTLDLITVSVEAGLSFDGAMARVISNISGELCDEFAKALKEIRMGIERKTALKNMSERCDVKELSMLITSLIQADELGVSLSRVLRIEAANLRENRKQKSREKAMKAPIKMMIPLVLFIFPSIFIIILGPAVIKMINVFGGK